MIRHYAEAFVSLAMVMDGIDTIASITQYVLNWCFP